MSLLQMDEQWNRHMDGRGGRLLWYWSGGRVAGIQAATNEHFFHASTIDYDMQRKLKKITQPVLVQSLWDEFQVNKANRVATPNVPGQVLTKGQVDVNPEQQYIFRNGVGKLMHLQKP
jgi:hypothetical protein